MDEHDRMEEAAADLELAVHDVDNDGQARPATGSRPKCARRWRTRPAGTA
jgi:hypothetical protein